MSEANDLSTEFMSDISMYFALLTVLSHIKEDAEIKNLRSQSSSTSLISVFRTAGFITADNSIPQKHALTQKSTDLMDKARAISEEMEKALEDELKDVKETE